jgi:D-alanyl-D-alanine-carboxypeptidase/D-alanyl-D-alanine-endopeptidase
MFGKDGPPNTTATTFKIDPKVFDQYIGRYQLAPDIQIEVTRQDSRLFAQITGQPSFELFASSEREFYLMVFDARFTFVVDGQGRASALLMHTDTDQRAARVD